MDHLHAWLHGRLCAVQVYDTMVGYDLKQDGNAYMYLELQDVYLYFASPIHDTRDLP